MINFSIDKLRFNSRGLIPAVVVDSVSKKVLTVAYMNRESLEITMKEGRTCFYRRVAELVYCTSLENWRGDEPPWVRIPPLLPLKIY